MSSHRDLQAWLCEARGETSRAGGSMTEKEIGAMRIANRFMLYAGGAGLVPIPVFDIAAVTAVQVKMLSDLAKHYNLPFSKDYGKSLVTALIGGVLPTTLGYGGLGSFLKRMPLVGPIVGVFTVSAFAATSTYAVARVFIQHFESGGTFLDFKPAKVREHFASELRTAAA
jgi:uncharacterized protein (DUF697 family)